MKVAVPIFQGSVSPVFDFAQRLLVVHHPGTGLETREELDLAGVPSLRRAGYLLERGVRVLICGGISAHLAAMMEMRGIRIISGVAGEIGPVVRAFLAGKLPDADLAMPGWKPSPRGTREIS
jgi:predicted Fe-Mo cluster-binding NifX family protein